MKTKDIIEVFVMGKTPVTPAQMNHRRRFDFGREPNPSKAKPLGDGNSGHLKREPNPFQMSDAIARFRGRVFYTTFTRLRHVIDMTLTTRRFVKGASMACQTRVNGVYEERLYHVNVVSKVKRRITVVHNNILRG